jgi:hypothetical protein
MSNRKNSAETLQIRHKGKTYAASYAVAGDKVTVISELGSKTSTVRGLTADQTARVLLKEIVQGASTLPNE